MARFRFPVPCPEPWDAMRPTSSGRHCEKCDKTIVDLGRMTARDASLLVALSPGLCARLAAGALIAGCGAAPLPPQPPEPVRDVRVAEVAADPDPDRDGIPTADDLCPRDAEDKDAFEDHDGCPDVDNDGDKIPDATDQCPNDPESYNASEDDDGCPDRLGIVISDTQIADRIAFARGSAVLPGTEIVAAIATLLANNPGFHLLHIRGHAAPKERFRAALAKQRAEVVRDALVAAGVDRQRLVIDVVTPTPGDKPEVDFHLDP